MCARATNCAARGDRASRLPSPPESRGPLGVARRSLVTHGPTETNLVNIHLAEYQALTNRNTYVIYIQSTMWPILVAILALMSFLIGRVDAHILTWTAVAMVLFVTYVYYAFAIDGYRNVIYVEHQLRARIEGLIATADFWGYETWLAGERHRGPQWFEYLPALFSALFTAGAVCYRLPCTFIRR